jgi:hypothetical protein
MSNHRRHKINFLNTSSTQIFLCISTFIFVCNLHFSQQFGADLFKNNHLNNNDKNVPSLDQCFCKLKGDVDDCNCKIDYIDKYNNYRLHPRINNLIETPYFRYIKMNINKICQFWADDARCSLRDCHVKVCNEVNALFLIS